MLSLTLPQASEKFEFQARFDSAIADLVAPEACAQISLFAQQFFNVIAIEELNQRRLSDLIGCTLFSWNMLQEFHAVTPKVVVFNPDYEKNGWQSTHSAALILHADCPFLVDSVRTEITRRGYSIHVLQNSVLSTRRDEHSKLQELVADVEQVEAVSRESLMFIELDRCATASELTALQDALEDVLAEVRLVVQDHQAMRERVIDLRNQLRKSKSLSSEHTLEETEFLDWMLDDRFTFLGYEEFKLAENHEGTHVVYDQSSLLGLSKRLRLGLDEAKVEPFVATYLREPLLLSFAKEDSLSRVHRPAYPDLVSIRIVTPKGKVLKECRFVGIFASRSYNESVSDIPLIRDKVAQIAKRSGFIPRSHLSKELIKVLEVLPRDDLFQTPIDDLLTTAVAIVRIQERARIRLFLRTDPYGRFVYVLAYVPRDIYSTEIRKRIQEVLNHRLQAVHSEFWTSFSESVLARVQFILKVTPGQTTRVDTRALEQEIIQACRFWNDEYRALVIESFGEAAGTQLLANFVKGFPAGYRERFAAHSAVVDLQHLETLSAERPVIMSFYQPPSQVQQTLHCKLYHADRPLHLSDVLPILENLGLRVLGEFPYKLERLDGREFWIHDFTFTGPAGQSLDLQQLNDTLQDAFVQIVAGHAENDAFNRLVLSAGMNWRDVALLRALARYLKQIRLGFDLAYIASTLLNHSDIAKELVRYFRTRFYLARKLSAGDLLDKQARLEQAILAGLDQVAVLNEDRILRRYLDLIKATVRTNFYQMDANGKAKSYFSFKFTPRQIPDIPRPAPLFEVFVYSSRVEGVHLRGGKVARGGLRWSDREEDYRTEVLGLVKAQQVKNSVIVPVGAKGGFVPRRLPPNGTRDEIQQEAIACYRLFISGLLDLTDNLQDGLVVPPQGVVRHDDDDPYLVVAADKGTATFSDIANDIAAEYAFWLGDAFASGGSVGYDHKGMGITAKGGWVSVERHFRESGIDVQEDSVSVVGIGDMAGDVFGNGLLLSNKVQLVAAFNHLHIFIDPSPEPLVSFNERQRMFNLPRSNWTDYDATLLSPGGGIFSRAAKYIEISPQMGERFAIAEDRLSPTELIRALLKAPVDLIWNGGIGTYVKAASEQHSDVGDKSNDNLRVDGRDVRARVVAEGGNLGMTQLGRIEYALRGGRSNTDFIDNAGGVDCSDHEVNIKILLNERVHSGDLTKKQRNIQLANMTDAVSELVLNNNYKQTQALSLAEHSSARLINDYYLFMEDLEGRNKLDRALEFLPTREHVNERAIPALTRPELAVLISYSKIDLKESLINAPLAQHPQLLSDLRSAFPSYLAESYESALVEHRLKGEIIATQLANDLVNHMGITFVSHLQRLTGRSKFDIAMAYVIVRDIYRLPHWFRQIEALDYKVAATTQMVLMQSLIDMSRRAAGWLLRNRQGQALVQEEVDRFGSSIRTLAQGFDRLQSGAQHQAYSARYDELMELGCGSELAGFMAGSGQLHSLLPIVEAAQSTARKVEDVARVHFAVGNALDLAWYQHQIDRLPAQTSWQAQARESLRDELDALQREIAIRIIGDTDCIEPATDLVEGWIGQRPQVVGRWLKTLAALRDCAEADYAMFSVAHRELLNLANN